MKSKNKLIIKLAAYLETHNLDDFKFYNNLQLEGSSLFCLETEVALTKKNEASLYLRICFECKSKRIYLEDYGNSFSNPDFAKNETHTFDRFFKDFVSVLLSIDNKNEFQSIILTTSRYENFSVLTKLGFMQNEVLNHYGNTKFVYNLAQQI